MINAFFNKLILKLTDLSPLVLSLVLTVPVIILSMLFVFLVCEITEMEYSAFFFMLSTVLPLMLSPVAIFLIIKFTKNLRYCQSFLDEEIQKNKQKDIILYEQARFALMGEMMANISHQWKQPLHTINAAILSVKFADKKDDEQLNKVFDIVEDNVTYLANTVNDFLSFFDKKTHQDKKKISEVIAEVKSIAKPSLDMYGIILEIETDSKVDNVLIVSSISQIILNLISNAKDALLDANKEGEKKINVVFKVKKAGIEIICCDNGDGVDPAISKKIFDPYFTTKDRNRGTGLGLYMSRQIVQTIFAGKIYVDENKLSCFHTKIPYGENCSLEKK
jgi:signal transduction histidine kinase